MTHESLTVLPRLVCVSKDNKIFLQQNSGQACKPVANRISFNDDTMIRYSYVDKKERHDECMAVFCLVIKAPTDSFQSHRCCCLKRRKRKRRIYRNISHTGTETDRLLLYVVSPHAIAIVVFYQYTEDKNRSTSSVLTQLSVRRADYRYRSKIEINPID